MTAALLRYPRRFRWSAARDAHKHRESAILQINGRSVGGVVRYSDGRGWSAWLVERALVPEQHRRRCDAKRAVECAAVAAESKTV